MTKADRFNIILKHTWTEPRFKAEMEWFWEYGNPFGQIFAQLGSQPASKADGDVREWLEDVADEEVTVVIHEPPDWAWWEPTSEWRRKQERERELTRLLAS